MSCVELAVLHAVARPEETLAHGDDGNKRDVGVQAELGEIAVVFQQVDRNAITACGVCEFVEVREESRGVL